MSDELPLIGVIAKLELKPGDIVCLKAPGRLPREVVDRIINSFKPLLPHDNKVIVLEGLDISVISPSGAHVDDQGVDPSTTDLFKPTGNNGVVNAEICHNSLLLLCDTDITQDLVSSWTQDQLDRAYDWAMRLHLHASDNPGVFVPQRPDFIPKFARPVGIDGWTPRTWF